MIQTDKNPDFLNSFLEYSSVILNKSPNSVKEYNYDLNTFLKYIMRRFHLTKETDFSAISIKEMTVDTLKSNIDKIKEQAVKIAEEEISKLSNASIENVYFSETKDQENYSYQNALVFVLKGKYTSLTETSTKYVEFRLFNTYLDGENLAYSDESAGIGYLKKDDIEKYSSYLDDEDYKVTKIQ